MTEIAPPRLQRSRVRLTATLAYSLERYLEKRGQPLHKPQEIRDFVLQGLVLRREATGVKSWHFGYSLSGRRGRVKVGNFPALSVEAARTAAKSYAAEVAAGRDPVEQKRSVRVEAERNRERLLGLFVEGRYREWAEVHLGCHAATLEAIRADFGSGDGDPKNGDGEGKRRGKRGAGWWDRRMDQITVLDVERWRRSELKRGIKPSTINRGWQRFRAVLGKAVDWKVIDGPPLKIKRLRVDARGRVRFFSEKERQVFFRELEAREKRRREQRDRMNVWLRQRRRPEFPQFEGRFCDHVQPLARLLLGTGLRRGEALSLTWADVDFDQGLVNVRGVTSKSGQSRAVPMTADVKDTLQAWREQNLKTSSDDLVFSTPQGGRIRRVDKAWKSLMEHAAIKNFRVHDARHDYASRLAMAGVELFTIAKLLGHSNVAMTQRYAHLSPNHLQEAVRRLESAA